jgi:predicted transcriptional regulator
MDLRSRRNAIGLSQSRLARLSGVSRFKLCLFELGDGPLSPTEQQRIRSALHAEAERLRNLSIDVEFDQAALPPVAGGAR